ncbi:hypothetical protein MNEG_10627 [Monoraphidium neglectum]|uniref:Uncharacterized protein n=1 Tax=Monoraphidium neglectum TaxID=145388 RepID=A0A0D2M0Z2_9CHLO|nr:hypothetical protein MNEG_10627 [Monoraphidium neglectum]KIY97334.1 hypothetical protein MNEG_10627 [Monoraphidium neglectum]|eukprot:XP_013896354.1 hypothetical protein MNEG_10627 [Monoraphidium neglectum]
MNQINLLYYYGTFPNDSPKGTGPYGQWLSYFTPPHTTLSPRNRVHLDHALPPPLAPSAGPAAAAPELTLRIGGGFVFRRSITLLGAAGFVALANTLRRLGRERRAKRERALSLAGGGAGRRTVTGGAAAGGAPLRPADGGRAGAIGGGQKAGLFPAGRPYANGSGGAVVNGGGGGAQWDQAAGRNGAAAAAPGGGGAASAAGVRGMAGAGALGRGGALAGGQEQGWPTYPVAVPREEWS